MNNKLIDESLNILRKARERYRRVYVMFSGGKDSLVALDLAAQIFKPNEMKIVFIEVTGNTDKCNIEYVHRIYNKHFSDYDLIHVKPPYDFYEVMIKWGIPGLKARWCMDKYKIQPLRRFVPPFFVLGIRRTDSTRRAQIYTAPIIRAEWHVKRILILPLLNWTKQDVYDYIRQQGLELSPCYKKYGHSGNCMFCPYHRKKAITLTLQDPYWREKIINALKQIRSLYNKNNKSRFKENIIRYWLNNPILHNHKITDFRVIL